MGNPASLKNSVFAPDPVAGTDIQGVKRDLHVGGERGSGIVSVWGLVTSCIPLLMFPHIGGNVLMTYQDTKCMGLVSSHYNDYLE